IEKFADAAHAHGVPRIIDNTFPTPVNLRPFEFGADIVVHSTTKYMDGHACALGGVVVDGGRFNWMAHADKFPGLTTPDDSYHGLTYAKDFGSSAYITKLIAQLMRDLGSMQSPQNAFLLNLGLETLHLRMPRHVENAMAVARYLEASDKITWVNYPGLESNKYYGLAQKYMPNGTCGVISFGIKGGREAATKFMDGLKLAAVVTHVADARTCVLHPASTTHRQLSDEQLADAGVGADLIRFSVGIEDKEDIIADIEQALANI
ncbi:MAG: PLP-dependent transferase, partial [Clostridia bacterium]|nr:PLP-dependent transferase [Clostridia bacterium]